MCALLSAEIYEGLVYSFESKKLASDTTIKMVSATTTDSHGDRPFVCLSIKNGICIWAEISKQRKVNEGGDNLRLPIISDWRKNENGYSKGKWITDDQYIHGCLYEGQCGSFCLAGNDIRQNGSRRYITKDGVVKIKEFFKCKKNITI